MLATQNSKDSRSVKNQESQRLATTVWATLPRWQQDNHFILHGYRPASGSFAQSASGLLYMHNETINVYTHLLGAVVFTAIAVRWWRNFKIDFPTADSEDVAVFACFFLGAIMCLSMSAVYHLISNHSEKVAKFGNKLDYLGIVFLIWGSFIPSISYGFACDPFLVKQYWTMVNLLNLLEKGGAATDCGARFLDHCHRSRVCSNFHRS